MFTGKEHAYAVYKEKSFSAAAKKLFITQPALSNTIKRIETKLGFPIFDRSVSPIRLTEEGKVYIDTIEKLMSIEENFGHFLDDFHDMNVGSIKIGGNSMLVSYILPKLISSYQSLYPQIQLEVNELDFGTGIDRLSKGSLDMLFSNRDFLDPQFECIHHTKEYLFLAVPKSYEINNQLKAYWQTCENIRLNRFQEKMYPAVPLDYFDNIPFINLNQENEAYHKVLNACCEKGFSPRFILSMNQEFSSYNMTCAGMGASFVSNTLINQTKDHSNVVYYKLPEDVSVREIMVYLKKNHYRSKCLQAFLEMLS